MTLETEHDAYGVVHRTMPRNEREIQMDGFMRGCAEQLKSLSPNSRMAAFVFTPRADDPAGLSLSLDYFGSAPWEELRGLILAAVEMHDEASARSTGLGDVLPGGNG